MIKRVAALVVFVGMAATVVSTARTALLRPAPVSLRPPQPRPDILLVTIDALRADHLSSSGYDRLTSPAIDAFAHTAVRFTSAIAQAPYTKASVASLMTGLYPSTHKTVTASVPFPETMTGYPTTAPILTDVLPASVTTLAEALHSAGYRTAGFTANPFLIEAFGFSRGFDRFQFYPGPDFAGGDRLVADAVDSARASDAGRPLFTWVHLMEPHSPYTPPRFTAGMFAVKGSAEPIAATIAIPGWLLPGSPRDRRPYVAAYDAEVAAADAAFDALLRELRSVRLNRPAVVVVTADHGEEFLDHGGWEHGSQLYDELIHVPMMIQAPDTAPANVDEQVQLVDLFPTLLGFAGATVPRNAGHSLGEHLTGGGSHPALSEVVGSMYSVRDERFKLIALNDGRQLLFDLTADPHEHHDLAEANRARAERLRRTLDRLLAEATTMGREVRGETVPVDPAIAERLRSLGYLR